MKTIGLSDLKIIFVVGSVRSGTSIVGQALNQILGKGRGFFEGNATGLLTAVADAVDGYYGNFRPKFLQPSAGFHIGKFPKEWTKALLQQLIVAEFAQPVIAGGEGIWVDKSPDGGFRAERIRACEMLARVFPQAKFVFCRRNGVENVASRLRKWGDADFVTHCHGWAAVMSAWENMRPLLAGRYVEIDQQRLWDDPGEVADRLALTLAMTPEERDAVHVFCRDNNPEMTSPDRGKPPRALHEVDWDLMQKWIFAAICGPAMQRFRYEIGETPAAHPAAPVLSLDPSSTIKVDKVNVDAASRQALELPDGFELRPAERGRRAPLLRFRSVPAFANMRLRGALVHGGCEGVGVHYSIRVAEPEGREIFARRFVVAPGDACELDEPFSCSTPFVDVEVSTSLSSHGVGWRVREEFENPYGGADGPRLEAEAPRWLRPVALARARVVGLSCAPDESCVSGAPPAGASFEAHSERETRRPLEERPETQTKEPLEERLETETKETLEARPESETKESLEERPEIETRKSFEEREPAKDNYAPETDGQEDLEEDR